MPVARLVGIAAFALAAALVARPAAAQEVERPALPDGARGNAFELGVGAGWTYGWDGVTTGYARPVRSARSGAALDLQPSFRIAPSLALGAYGFGAELSETAAVPAPARLLQAGAGVQGTWHFRPSAWSYDPWLSLGAGWRAQWLDYEAHPTTAQSGVEMVRARAGLDVRVSPSVALSPELGAALSTFLTEEVLGGPWHGLPPRLDTFVFAGIRATIDIPLNAPPPEAHAIP